MKLSPIISTEGDLSVSASDIEKLPLTAALLQQNATGRLSFHMPGHRNGKQWPSWFAKNLALLDSTELAGSDDLLNPSGPALASIALASDYYGAGWSRFLTAGTTSGILSLLAACPGKGGRLMLSGSCHQSVMHASALLDLELIWIKPSLWPQAPAGTDQPLTLLPQISAKDVRDTFARCGSCDAVFITSPDYYGSCAQLQEIADVVHEMDAVLLVDEAHGAHLAAGKGLLPVSAMAAGADACVQSAHKTLPALTPGAIIHLSEQAISRGRLKPDRVSSMLKVFHTSSPSFLVAASIEYALKYLFVDNQDAIAKMIAAVSEFSSMLPESFVTAPLTDHLSAPDSPGYFADRDPTRVVVGFRDKKLSAASLSDYLALNGIDVEMTDTSRLVLILPLDISTEDLRIMANHCADWLKKELNQDLSEPADFVEKSPNKKTESISGFSSLPIADIESKWRVYMTRMPKQDICPGDIMYGRLKKDYRLISEAEGCILAAPVVPYPPGVPLFWPGEKLSKEMLAFIISLSENGVNMTGIENKSLLVLV